MVVTPDSLGHVVTDRFETEYDDAAVYGDAVLHEGAVGVRAGRVERPTGRLLSPSAVHHGDVHPA